MEQKQIQQEYDNIISKINNIKQEIFGNPQESDSITEEAININQSVADIRRNFMRTKFKEIDKKIFEENKEHIEQLKPLLKQADKVWGDRYGIRIGELTPYESCICNIEQFNKENIGYKEEYSNDHLKSYLTCILESIISGASYLANAETRWNIDDFTEEERALIPTEQINSIKEKINDLKFEYRYMNKKACNDFAEKDMLLRHKLDDYRYEKDKIEHYCKRNNIELKTYNEFEDRWKRQ